MLTLAERVPYRGAKYHGQDSGPKKHPGCPRLHPCDVGLDDMTVQSIIPREVMEAAIEAAEEMRVRATA